MNDEKTRAIHLKIKHHDAPKKLSQAEAVNHHRPMHWRLRNDAENERVALAMF